MLDVGLDSIYDLRVRWIKLSKPIKELLKYKMKILTLVLCVVVAIGTVFVISQLSTVPNVFEPANHKLEIEIENVTILNSSYIKFDLYNNYSQRLFNCAVNIINPITATARFGILETGSYMNLTVHLSKHPLSNNSSINDIQVNVYGYGLL